MAHEYRPIHAADLLLPKVEWESLMTAVRSKLYAEDSHWLNSWEHFDQTHVMNDSERADARVQSYHNWYRRLRESLVA